MLIVLLLACATNPLNRSNAVVVTEGDGAWAKVISVVSPVCVDMVFELVLPLDLVKTHAGSSAGLWQQAYPYMLNKTFTFLYFTYNTSVAIVRGCNEIKDNYGDANAEVFYQCVATPSPTSAPSPAPSYGPLLKSECESGWNWGAFDDNGQIFVRYCDTPVCNGVFLVGNLSANACPPYPGEALVQLNTTSDICRSAAGIEMMYNGGDYLCNQTHLCSNDNSLYYNACIPPYPNYGPMNESECIDMGGVVPDWAIHKIGDHITTRYCNVSACTEVYTNGLGQVYNACPATPSEGRIRNNAYPCDYCIENDIITMMYCNVTCTGTWRCPNNPTLFLNACLDTYTPGPYGPMTEDECFAMGGSDFYVTTENNNNQTVVRYCNVPMCYLQYGVQRYACPPTPNELQVMKENCQICWVSGETWKIEMMYCGSTPGCAFTHLCSTEHSLFNNACVGAYPDYGPMTKQQCIDRGGNGDYWANATENGIVATRYCGNIDICSGVYRNQWEDVGNACPALPSEGRVRNNAYPCNYCIVNGSITMMYCNETCTGTYQCPGVPGYYENACTLYYPEAVPDYGPMNEDECLNAYNGTAWAEYNFTDTGVRYVRYCIGASPCWQHFNPINIDEVEVINNCAYVNVPVGAIPLDVQNISGFCMVYNVTIYYTGALSVTEPLWSDSFQGITLQECASNFSMGLSIYTGVPSSVYAPLRYMHWQSDTGFCEVLGGPDNEITDTFVGNKDVVGIPINATFMNTNACPPLPSEARVRNNRKPCTYCMGNESGDPIEMMYCENTDGCTGNYHCSHAGIPYVGAYTNACTQQYVVTPTFAPTAAPTSAPTTYLYMEECFVYDGFVCSNDANFYQNNWCKEDDFYKVAQYSIHPHALSKQPATATDVALLQNPEQVAEVVGLWLGNASASAALGVCWCTTKSSTWFPYGPVAYANVSSFRTISNTSFPHEFWYKHSTFTYYTDLCVRADALIVIESDGETTIAQFGDPLPAECFCSYETTYLPLFGATQCAFVCVAPMYVGDLAPLSLARTPATNVKECSSNYFLWINQWHLIRMVHSLYWQEIANKFMDVQPLQYTWVPWWNTSDDTNCVAVAEEYCSIVLEPYISYTDFWDMDESKRALDYAGVGTWLQTGEGTLNKLIPVIYANVSAEEGVALRAAVHMLFWTNMATHSVGAVEILREQCVGNKSYVVHAGSYSTTITVPVIWVGSWNKTGCTGLYGCSALSAEACLVFTGCMYMDDANPTSTTTTTTMIPGTMPPPVTTATMQSQLQLDSDAFTWLFFLAGAAAIVMMIVTARLNRPPPSYAQL